jgi:hypothetical protein
MGYIYGLSIEYLLGLLAWIGLGLFLCRILLLARRKHRGQPGRQRWANLGLSVWMIFATLTVVEVYLAFFYDQTDSFNATLTSTTWYRRHVDPYKNSEGFRDRQPLEKHPSAGRTRIWFLGDSFTLGHGIRRVEDRFSDRVAHDLDQQVPGKFLVNNLSDAGTNGSQILGLMKVYWNSGYDPPRVAVYVMCLNDIEVYLPGADQRPAPGSKLGFSLTNWVVQKSYLLNFLWFRLSQSQQARFKDYFGNVAQAYADQPGKLLLAEIDRMQYECRKHHVDFRVVIFPFLHNLGQDYKFGPAHKMVAAHCRAVNIPVLDLRPVLEPHVSEGLTVNRFDAHPNERAHALAADAIEKQLLGDLTGLVRLGRPAK